jgi:hypothetical protein
LKVEYEGKLAEQQQEFYKVEAIREKENIKLRQ